jgi:hypothetical protein
MTTSHNGPLTTYHSLISPFLKYGSFRAKSSATEGLPPENKHGTVRRIGKGTGHHEGAIPQSSVRQGQVFGAEGNPLLEIVLNGFVKKDIIHDAIFLLIFSNH